MVKLLSIEVQIQLEISFYLVCVIQSTLVSQRQSLHNSVTEAHPGGGGVLKVLKYTVNLQSDRDLTSMKSKALRLR